MQGLSQEQFADYLGITRRTYIYRIKNQQPSWTIQELIKISNLIDGNIEIDIPQGRFDITIREIN